ncbi:hypothetical protein ACTZ91_000035 [Vibrio parahaemolyticus]|uniref:hypothetical protein n=1 Tax=Vibrio parahaemolyticus TaxID=670 RepID=UPI000B1CFDFB|nr:hypothetical protein [Vibrio parahaemolyticus]
MRLRNKSTYTKLTNAFNEHLRRNLELSIPFRKRDNMLAHILFNLSPNEVHQRLSRNKDVLVDWKQESDSVLEARFQNTIWPRVMKTFQGYQLSESQLIELMASTIKPALLDLEPSMVSMSFQNALGIEFVLVTDEKETKASTGHHLLKWHLPSRDNVIVPNSWTGLDNMRLYTPSSVKERYSAFDKQTFEIMSLSCNEVLIDAYRHAPKLNSQYSSLYNELHQLCDCHLLLLFVHEHYRLAEIMTQSIVDHYENECRFEKKENQVLVTILVGFLSFKRLISRSTACGISLKKSMRSLLIRTTYQPGTITLMSYIC